MRDDDIVFIQKNAAKRRSPRLVATFDVDGDGSNIYYATSHPDIITPDSAKTFPDILFSIPVESQSLDPINANSEIGYGQIILKDVIDDAFTNFLASEFAADNTLRQRLVSFYVGFEGTDFPTNYALIGSQIIDGDQSVDIVDYSLTTHDLLRAMRDTVFILEDTTLSKNVTATQTYIHIQDPTYFETLKHDANFSDAPSATVGYGKIDDAKEPEKFRWLNKEVNTIQVSGTDISFAASDKSINSSTTDLTGDGSNNYAVGMGLEVQNTTNNDGIYTIVSITTHKITVSETIVDESAGTSFVLLAEPQFYNCTRGVLGSKAIAHETDLTVAVDQRTKVIEHVYLETNVLKLIYGIQSGYWYGTSDAWPSKWSLGIDTTLLESSDYTTHYDLWNTGDDSGLTLRFEGEKDQDAKQFIETQLCFAAGGYLRILNNGKLGFRRFQRVLSTASPIAVFNKDNLINHSAITYAFSDIFNYAIVDWNYEDRYGKTTRDWPLTDLTSISKYRAGQIKFFSLRGLHGSIHTVSLLYSIFDMIRDRFASYPVKMSCTGMPELNRYEIGDIVLVDLDHVRDHTNNTTKRLYKSFEIQKKTFDPLYGEPTFELFGSAEPASVLSQYLDSTVMADSFYSAAGTDITSVTTGSWSAGVGSIWTITANHTFTGNADVNNSAAIYYCPGGLTIGAGVELTGTDNVQIRVMGLFTPNGGMTAVGQGLAGGTGSNTAPWVPSGNPGNAGYIGSVEAVGAINSEVFAGFISTRQKLTEGKYGTAPYLVLTNNGGTSISGIPTDFRGTSGGSGGPVKSRSDNIYPFTVNTAGGNGANGPGAFLIICRGMAWGASGYINVSGSQGSAGSVDTQFGLSLYSGAGAPSHPSAVYVLLDGNDSLYPENKIIATLPATQDQGSILWNSLVSFNEAQGLPQPYGSYYRGSNFELDCSENVFRVQYIPKAITPVEDIPAVATPATAITVTEDTTNNTFKTVIVRIGATAPSDGNYRGSFIRISIQNEDTWTDLGEVRSTNKIPISVAADGTTYQIRAYPVAKSTGKISEEYYESTHTVPSSVSPTVDSGTLNPGVVQNNTDALNSDCIFIHTRASNVNWDNVYNTGSWTKTNKSYGILYGNLTAAETGTYYGESIQATYDLTPYTWAKDRTIEAYVHLTSASEGRLFFNTGYYSHLTTTGEHFGFIFNASGNIVATVGDGTTEYTQTLQAYSSSSSYVIKAILDATAKTIKFYVDGVLKWTFIDDASTQFVPTGISFSSTALMTEVLKDTGSVTLSAVIGEIIMHQSP